MKPWAPEAANKPAPEKPMASDTTAAERKTQPLSSSQRLTGAVTPAKKAEASAPIRVAGPSFLGLSDDPTEVTAKDKEYDDLYKTHWGGRIAIVFVVLSVAAGLAYLQWRSGHAAASTATPKPPTAARVDNTNKSSAADAAAPAASPTNPPAAGSTQANNQAALNNQSVAGNAAASPLPNGSTQSPADVSGAAPAPPAPKSAAPAAGNAKAAAANGSISEGHEVAGKSQEDLEEPVRLAENYIQGRGVAQNCNAALGILRNASDRGNPRAEIKLGALYATGNCVAPDRVAAYRHFSRAIAAQPNNVYLEESRSRLWKDMTDTERKQAMEVEK
jgi:hypothetical protein